MYHRIKIKVVICHMTMRKFRLVYINGTCISILNDAKGCPAAVDYRGPVSKGRGSRIQRVSDRNGSVWHLRIQADASH